MKKLTKPKRCMLCDRGLGNNNKSGLCSNCGAMHLTLFVRKYNIIKMEKKNE